MREGLFWAALGKPLEVMPFLRGRLGGRVSQELLDELEEFYRRVACCGRVEEKHFRAIKSFHREIMCMLERA